MKTCFYDYVKMFSTLKKLLGTKKIEHVNKIKKSFFKDSLWNITS